MENFSKNGSRSKKIGHCKKWVTFRKKGHIVKKWVTFRKKCHTVKKGSHLEMGHPAEYAIY